NGSAVRLGDALGDRKSQPGARLGLAGRSILLSKPFEQAILEILGDSASAVDDADPRSAVDLAQANNDGLSRRGELDCVGYEIGENLHDPALIDVTDDRPVRQLAAKLDLGPLRHGQVLLDRGAHDVAKVARLLVKFDFAGSELVHV